MTWQLFFLQKDKLGFTKLARDLKAAFEPKELILAASLSGYKALAQKAYEVSQLNKYLDLVSINSYDYSGHWYGSTGYHSPLYGTKTDKDQSFNVVRKPL